MLFWAVILFMISAFYLYKYGFRTVIQTDVLQFIFMFAGFAILMGVLLKNFTFTTDILPALPKNHTKLTGGYPGPIFYPGFSSLYGLWWIRDFTSGVWRQRTAGRLKRACSSVSGSGLFLMLLP